MIQRIPRTQIYFQESLLVTLLLEYTKKDTQIIPSVPCCLGSLKLRISLSRLPLHIPTFEKFASHKFWLHNNKRKLNSWKPVIFLRFIRILKSKVSKQKFYCAELNKQGRLSLKLLQQGRETKFNSTETESRIFF